ncbi:SGNH/GDSL hydrolase family protein [Rheinheimera maricola]|uniref:SGNH/GDSL hydrolase family protein n=1 Tax=Rheinheimera maricola TaxID=2793282 RepID=A0ABS7X492_9GAMM|nr:SGNH/GDSL hydrolase family protein [Rheinheimera maricola]MBZ9610361.1 SGNH/GDSL hydrolase family protein [Rheinheimera maricola]
MAAIMLRVLLSSIVLSVTGCGATDEAPDSANVDNPPGVIVTPAPPVNGLTQCGITQYSTPVKPMALPNGFSSVIMGSSSAAGAGASQGSLSWAGQFSAWQQSSGRAVTNIAKGGHTTYQGLAQYCLTADSRPAPDNAHNVSQALALQPDLVIIAYPSNDAALGWSANESVANIMLIRSVLADAGVASVVMSAQPRSLSASRTALLQEFDRLLLQQLPDCVVSLYNALQQDNRLNPQYDAGDGVHLNDQGHAVVFDALREMLTQGDCVSLPE